MITDRYQNHVRLNLPTFGPALLLDRTPKLLRFVVDADGKWDALNHLEDEPKPDEQIVVAKLMRKTTMHIDYRNARGLRIGEWIQMVDYDPIPDQPPDEIVRDTTKWRVWCEARDQLSRGN